jgi:Tol biopolymer transport system component
MEISYTPHNTHYMQFGGKMNRSRLTQLGVACLLASGLLFIIGLFTSSLTAAGGEFTVYLPLVVKPLPPPVQGQGILFISDRQAAETFDLYRMDADGSNVQRLTELSIQAPRAFNHTFLPRWSPDGTRIAFQVNGKLYLMAADGSDLQLLIDDPQSWVEGLPEWSPDGSKLALISFNCTDPEPDFCGSYTSSGSGLQVFDLASSNMTMIIEDVLLKWIVGVHWLPDNTSIVVAPDTGGGASGLFIGYLDGSPHDHVFQGQYIVDSLAVAPDGYKLAFSTFSGILAYTAGIDGNNVEQFHNGAATSEFSYGFNWHPTQPRLVYAVARNMGFDHTIYTTNLDGTPRFEVTSYDNQRRKRVLGWTPDGTQLIYMSDINHDHWIYDIYRVNADGSNPINLTPNSPASDIASDYFP